MSLIWSLTNLKGVRLAELPPRKGASVAVALNEKREAQIDVSMEGAGRKASKLARPHATVLRCYLDGAPIANCPILRAPQKPGTGIQSLSGPDNHRLTRSYVGMWPTEKPPLVIADGTDQGEIIWKLLDYANPPASYLAARVPGLGIRRGASPLTVGRDREYEPGKGIWEAALEMTRVIAGCDIELVPLDGIDGILWELVIHERQGFDRSASVRFEYRTGRHNVADLTYDPAGEEVVNRALFSGMAVDSQPSVVRVSDQVQSQIAHGVLADYQGRTDVSDPDTLLSHARGLASVAAFAPDYFELTLPTDAGDRYRPTSQGPVYAGGGYGRPYRFGPNADCWLGDVVTVMAKLYDDEPPKLLRGRIISGKLTQADDAGNLMTEIVCAPTINASIVT